MFRLNKITGPECPECGCCEGDTLSSTTRVEFDRDDMQLERPVREETQLRRQCSHCGKRFTVIAALTNGQHPDARVIDFPILRCPYCQSGDNFVSSSPRTRRTGTKFRHHKCRSCKRTFTTREKRAA